MTTHNLSECAAADFFYDRRRRRNKEFCVVELSRCTPLEHRRLVHDPVQDILLAAADDGEEAPVTPDSAKNLPNPP